MLAAVSVSNSNAVPIPTAGVPVLSIRNVSASRIPAVVAVFLVIIIGVKFVAPAEISAPVTVKSPSICRLPRLSNTIRSVSTPAFLVLNTILKLSLPGVMSVLLVKIPPPVELVPEAVSVLNSIPVPMPTAGVPLVVLRTINGFNVELVVDESLAIIIALSAPVVISVPVTVKSPAIDKLPVSSSMALEFCISLPVVPSNLVNALSVALAGPVTSPAPGAVAAQLITPPVVDDNT